MRRKVPPYSKPSAFRVGVESQSNRNVHKAHEDCDDGEDNNPEKRRVKGITARQQALVWLAKREYSVAQLRHKLLLKEYSESEVSALLIDLQARGWLNESRFVECTIRARSRKGIGPMRLQQELQQKGIVKSLIQENEEWISADWEQVAEAAYLKKYQEKPMSDFLEQKKRAQFLVGRGFDPSLAWKIVQRMVKK